MTLSQRLKPLRVRLLLLLSIVGPGIITANVDNDAGGITTYSVAGSDVVTRPSHYVGPVPGIECIEVTQHFNFNRGNVIKYVWRAGAKGDEIEDLRKARQYLDFEIDRLTQERNGS